MQIWIPMFVYMCVTCVSPGPNNLNCLYIGANYGAKPLVNFAAGSMGALYVKYLILAVLNALLAQYLPAAVQVLKWVGGAYMVYLAVKMGLSGWKETADTDVTKVPNWKDGILLQAVNAKSWISICSIFAVYVVPITTKISTAIVIATLGMVPSVATSALYGCCGIALSGFINRYKKPFGIVMGLALLWCAVQAVL